MKKIWSVACLACCAFLLTSASAFALAWAPYTVQLTPDPNGANFQVDERLTGPADIDLPLPEGYANQALRYDVYNYSNLDITAFAVGINMDSSYFDGDFDVTLEGPDNWNVEVWGGVLGYDVDISGSGLNEEYLDGEILEEGYTDVFVAWTNDHNAAIHGYTGMIDTFIFDLMYEDLYGDALDLASPVVVVAGGNVYTGGTSNDPNHPNVPLGNPPAPVPEPSTMLLFGTGLAGFVGMRRRKAEK